MSSMAGNQQDFELPGDLGEKDPRRQAHPQGNLPGQGGHEVKLGSSEAKGVSSAEGDEAHAANNSTTDDPRHDNTAEHALEGGSRETMNRQKRQEGGSSDLRGEADDVTQPAERYGSSNQGNTGAYDQTRGNSGAYDQSNTGSFGQQGTTGAYDQSNTGSYGQQGTTGAFDQSRGTTGAYDQGSTGSYGQTGTTGLSEGTTGLARDTGVSQGTGYSSGQTSDPHGHHSHEGQGQQSESFITKAYNAVTGSGSGNTSSTTGSSLTGGQSGYDNSSSLTGGQSSYDNGSSLTGGQSAGHHTGSSLTGGSDGHNTRAGEYLDPASGRDTGIPGYAGSSESNQGGFSSGTSGSTGTGYTQ